MRTTLIDQKTYFNKMCLIKNSQTNLPKGNLNLNAWNCKRAESHSYAAFVVLLKVIHGDYLIITLNFPFLFCLQKLVHLFLFRDTIKLLGEFKLPIREFCKFSFSVFFLILFLFEAFFLFEDRSVYLLIHSICVLPSASQKYI